MFPSVRLAQIVLSRERMSLRDDHNAALARADALQRELDQAEQDLRRSQTDRATLRESLTVARAKLDMVRQEPQAQQLELPARSNETHRRPLRGQMKQWSQDTRGVVYAGLLVFFFLVLFALAWKTA